MANIQLNLKKDQFVPSFYPLLLDYSHRWEFYVGSAGSGKSFSICQKIIIRCCREPIRVLVCRRYASTLRNSCFALFKQVLGRWKLTPYVKIRETDMSIHFPNGSSIILIGLDDEEKLLSLTDISTIWVEEAFQVPKPILEQLNIRMRGSAKNQQIILSWNPISKHSYLYDFTVVNPPENSIYHHSTYQGNPFLSQEYLAIFKEMAVRNPQKYRVFGLGEWGIDSDGLIYQNFKVEEFDHAKIEGQLLVGLDFGFVNDTSALVASILDDESKRIYIFKEWGARNKTNSELAQIITQLGFSKSVIIADSSEPKSIEEIKRSGVIKIKPCEKGKDSIIHGIQKLQNYELIIHPECKELIVEIENYTWSKDKFSNLYINKPDPSCEDHYLDALRYSLQCAKAKLKTLDKNLF